MSGRRRALCCRSSPGLPGARPGLSRKRARRRQLHPKYRSMMPPIDRRQRDEVGDRRAFVDLMHGLPDQAEFEHRAIILDEARVRRAAGGRKLRLAAGDFGDGGDGEIGERSRLGDEHVGVRRLPVDGKLHAAGGGGLRALLDQRLERSLAVAVVEADVEARARFAGNEVDRRVADIDGGEFKMRRIEMLAAVVERRLQRGDQRRQAADRIVGAIGIGDVTLAAGDDQRAVERAAAAGLDGVADDLDIARLAEDAVVECLAALRRPFQKLDGAVDRDALLVAGDEERDRAPSAGRRWPRDDRAPRRRSRRCRPSCRRRRVRRACRPRPRRQTADAATPPHRPAAPRRYARQRRDSAARCRCGRKGFRSARCRARQRSRDGR